MAALEAARSAWAGGRGTAAAGPASSGSSWSGLSWSGQQLVGQQLVRLSRGPATAGPAPSWSGSSWSGSSWSGSSWSGSSWSTAGWNQIGARGARPRRSFQPAGIDGAGARHRELRLRMIPRRLAGPSQRSRLESVGPADRSAPQHPGPHGCRDVRATACRDVRRRTGAGGNRAWADGTREYYFTPSAPDPPV